MNPVPAARRTARLATLLAWALLLGACAIEPGDMADIDDTIGQSADGIALAGAYDNPLRSHHAVNVGLRASTPLLDRDGAPFGPELTAFEPGGAVRIQGNERVWNDARHDWLYYVWGDNGVKSGFVAGASLRAVPSIDGETGGNGHAAPSNCRTWYVRPTEIPSDLRFARHDGDGVQTLATYGTPGGAAFPNYTYLTWNVVDVDGGGLVRSILRDGAVFHAANVRRVTISSVDRPGSVTFMYGWAWQGGHRVYGWTTVYHDVDGHRVYHVALASAHECS